MKRYQVIGILAFAVVMSVNADDPSQGREQQSARYEQSRNEEARRQAVDNYREARKKQERCNRDSCRRMYQEKKNYEIDSYMKTGE